MKLILAPSAQTDTSIAVVWDKPEDAQSIEEYVLYLNGREAARVKETDYTFENLTPDTEYTIRLGAVMKEGFLPQSNLVTARTRKKPQVFDVTAFGAVGDGGTMNTQAIQNAIDACAPGGMVYVPEGVFLTGALFLKSDMTLYVEIGGKLLGSDRPEDYPLMTYLYEGRQQLCHASLINTKEEEGRVHDITIAGGGTIDGNGNDLSHKNIVSAAGFYDLFYPAFYVYGAFFYGRSGNFYTP